MFTLSIIAGLALTASTVSAAPSLQPTKTVYVNRHFELRDHDAPVKYVFNGQTRVARVTGSLTANERIQRLRLRAGWNLVSLAVTAPDFLDQLRDFTDGPSPVIQALYQWQPATKDFGTITSGASVAAGTVLWISARTNAVVAVRGRYVDPAQWSFPGGGSFVAVPALELQPLLLPLPAGVTVWRYDSSACRWQTLLSGALASLSDLPAALGPGEAIYLHSNDPGELGALEAETRVRYYHQDHLGSSSVTTDADGVVIEETTYHPFGVPRHEHSKRPTEESYKFTQKERDLESGLHYFEARYQAGSLGRFLSVDSKYSDPDGLTKDDAGRFLANPQEMNLYSYTRNNPLNYVDPTGLDVTVKTEALANLPGRKDTQLRLTGVIVNESSRRFTTQQLEVMRGKITRQLNGDFSGSGDSQTWTMKASFRVVKSAADIKPTDHVIRIVDNIPREPGSKHPPNAITLGQADQLGGKQVRVRSDLVSGGKYPARLEEIVSHEIGHTLGLQHENEDTNPVRATMGSRNLMRAQTTEIKGTQVNVHQIREIQTFSDSNALNR